MEEHSEYLGLMDVDKLTTDDDYLWTSLEDICQRGNVKEYCDFLSILHRHRHVDIKILFNVVKTERNGETLMQICARHGNVDLIRYFLRNGISVNQDNSSGWTTLHEACKFNQAQVSSRVVENLAVNSADNEGVIFQSYRPGKCNLCKCMILSQTRKY